MYTPYPKKGIMYFGALSEREVLNCDEIIHFARTFFEGLRPSKKVRAKDMIRSQIETWSEVSAKSVRAEGALYGEGMKSVLRARANSEGGRKARNEILIVSFFESKIYL